KSANSRSTEAKLSSSNSISASGFAHQQKPNAPSFFQQQLNLFEFARQIGYSQPLAFSLAPRLRLKSTLSGMTPSYRQRRLLRRRRHRRARHHAQQVRRRDRGFRPCERYHHWKTFTGDFFL